MNDVNQQKFLARHLEQCERETYRNTMKPNIPYTVCVKCGSILCDSSQLDQDVQCPCWLARN
jgi:hypothetical protein